MAFGAALSEFSPARLIQVIQASAVITIALNIIALWKQETRQRGGTVPSMKTPTFAEAWESFTEGGRAVRRLTAVGLGTMAFSMQDILLEPYGGQVLHMTVAETTKLTAIVAFGGLLGFGWASRVLSRGADPFRIASYGAWVGVPAFIAVTYAATLQSSLVFSGGVFLIGLGGGLFSHGTLTATMNAAPADQRGLALGTWGAVQATAAGLAIAVGGILRDVVGGMPLISGESGVGGYAFVYSIEIVLLLATIAAMAPLVKVHRAVTA
jgi:BCD family chlorophyll transporter-like MFS transporter